MPRPWIAALAVFVVSIRGEEPNVLHVYHPRSWYADCLAGPAYASSDGRFLLYSSEGRFLLKDTQAGTLEPLAERIGWDDVGYARFVPGGHRVFVRGPLDGKRTERQHDLDDGSFHEPGVPASFDIWLRPAAGGPEVRLSRDAGNEVCQPEWSADGYELVFIAANASGRYRPVILELDPEQGTPVGQREFVPEGITGSVKSACYSPVAPELALEEDVDGERRLWIVSLDGTEKRLLATYRSFTELSGCDFTPDGESVVFCALEGGHSQLFRVAAGGGEEPVQLTHDEEEKYAPQVSPDGEHVALTVYTHTKTVLSRPFERGEASDE